MLRRLAIVAAAAGALAGCGSGSSSLPQGGETVDLDPSAFTTKIDNRWWPMQPGTRWTYRETDEQGTSAQVVVTVSSETKRIANGVEARIVRDTVSSEGEVVEDTFDWYAQDDDGNVWYLGEDTAEFEHGEVSSREGSFEAGVDGAQAGVIIPADPKPGLAYRQEYYEGEAEDNGEVLSLQERAQVPAGRYRDALLTKDTTPLEPDVLEYKLYPPGVGPVLTLGVSGSGGREALVRVETVSPAAAKAAGTTPLGKPYP